MPRKRSRVRTHYRRGPNGPVMVRGHERGGFSPHPERFKGRRPRSRGAKPEVPSVLLVVLAAVVVLVVLVVRL